MPHGARNRGPCSGASFLRAGCPAATRSSGSIRVVWSVPLGQSALTAPLPREQSRCQRPFLWGIAQGLTGHPLLRGRCIPSYWVRDRGHVRGLASVGQVARLRRSSDRSTMMTPVPLNHRFRAPIFSIRSVLVISLLRALIVTVIGLPVTSVRPGRTVASVRAAHSLGEPFSRNPSSIPSPPSSSQSSLLPTHLPSCHLLPPLW